VENAPEEMSHWVFIPGNHSHRIIDYVQKTSMVFLKKGFNADFLKTDASTRRSYLFLPCPKVLEYEPGKNWYVEQQVTGLPLNRLGQELEREQAIQQANKAMLALYKLTSQMTILSEYLQQLMKNINIQIQIIEPMITTGEREKILGISQKLEQLIIKSCDSNATEICLALSHGDYQAANILWEKPRVWIIDWEYAGVRSLYYDFFCYQLSSRSPSGLAVRIEALHRVLNQQSLFTELPVHILPGQFYYLWLFLLEELSLKLSEISTDEISQKMAGITPWMDEVLMLKQISSLND
jgi:thiamine kinase-like enzyme